jgi:hypothetical protein
MPVSLAYLLDHHVQAIFKAEHVCTQAMELILRTQMIVEAIPVYRHFDNTSRNHHPKGVGTILLRICQQYSLTSRSAGCLTTMKLQDRSAPPK